MTIDPVAMSAQASNRIHSHPSIPVRGRSPGASGASGPPGTSGSPGPSETSSPWPIAVSRTLLRCSGDRLGVGALCQGDSHLDSTLLVTGHVEKWPIILGDSLSALSVVWWISSSPPPCTCSSTRSLYKPGRRRAVRRRLLLSAAQSRSPIPPSLAPGICPDVDCPVR